MNATELPRLAYREVHDSMREDLTEVDPDDLWWQPRAGVNHVGFLFWHAVRDEDFMIQTLLNRRQPRWDSEAWAQRLGITATGQGTGMSDSDASAMRYPLEMMLEFATETWSNTDSALANLDEAELDRAVSGPGGTPLWSLASLLTTGSIGHNWVHLGEIRMLRGLRGWRYRE